MQNQSFASPKRAELIESLVVALLSVRNRRGTIIPISNPMHYATGIADHMLAQPDDPALKRKPKRVS